MIKETTPRFHHTTYLVTDRKVSLLSFPRRQESRYTVVSPGFPPFRLSENDKLDKYPILGQPPLWEWQKGVVTPTHHNEIVWVETTADNPFPQRSHIKKNPGNLKYAQLLFYNNVCILSFAGNLHQ